MPIARVLLIEDELGVVLTLTDRLLSQGYEVASESNGETGLTRALGEPFELIILDLMLPKKSGLDVCRALRKEGNKTPILMLTAKGQLNDKVTGLQTGADDYLTKPFEMPELLARVEALLRRAPPRADPQAYQFGNVVIHWKSATVTYKGQSVEMSAREFQLLKFLVEHRGETIPREDLLTKVWGYDAQTNTRTVDVHLAWLRQKLEDNPRYPEFFITIRGFGYKFNP
jgi:two-component system, OmpR family, alkaline phosphatase synthesis response regulator PhoP